MPVPFFRATRSVADNFTKISTFLAATQCSFWNTRLEVSGFSASVNGAPETLLHQRFVSGSSIQGVNISEAFVRNDSTYERNNLANLLLFTVIASYEGFLAEIVPGCGGTGAQIEQMQLSNRGPSGHSRFGILDALASFRPHRDPDMVKAFQANLRSNPRYSLTALNNQMIEYRLFKEIRNTMMHNRGIADARVVRAYSAVSAITASDLGVKEVPQMVPLILGNPVAPTLRSVIGLGDIILRVAASIDAELAVTRGGTEELLSRWQSAYGASRNLPGNKVKRGATVRRLVKNIGFPTPDDPDAVYRILRRKAIVL